jgi:hypothetical protein
MYANSGYATNTYATRRLFSVGPVVKLAMRILTSGYGIVNVLLLRFRGTILTNPSGKNNTILEL